MFLRHPIELKTYLLYCVLNSCYGAKRNVTISNKEPPLEFACFSGDERCPSKTTLSAIDDDLLTWIKSYLSTLNGGFSL